MTQRHRLGVAVFGLLATGGLAAVSPAADERPRRVQSGGFTLVVTNQGRITAWGADNYGQVDVPTGLSNIVAVAAGGDQSVALESNGTMTSWGRTFDQIPPNLANVTAISAGYQHFLALKADGTVATWGRSNCPANCVPSGLTGVKAIGAGWNHNVALLNNGAVTAWGLSGAVLNWNLTNVPAGLTDVAAISSALCIAWLFAPTVRSLPGATIPPARRTHLLDPAPSSRLLVEAGTGGGGGFIHSVRFFWAF